jgi:hypothetical protein
LIGLVCLKCGFIAKIGEERLHCRFHNDLERLHSSSHKLVCNGVWTIDPMNGTQGAYQQPYRAGAANGGIQYQQQQALQQPQYQERSRSNSTGPGPQSGQILPIASERRDPDYVYFERTPSTVFSKDAIARATAAKMKLELFYKTAVESAVERNTRFVCQSYRFMAPRILAAMAESMIRAPHMVKEASRDSTV